MSARMALMRPLRAATFKTPSSSASSLLAARAPRSQQLRTQQSRSYSSEQKSATGVFYKKFTRPVFKAALLAIFTYQLIYWAWVKLEQDEIKAEKQAEVARLENEVKTLRAAQVAAADVIAAGGSSSPAAGGEQEEGKKKSKSWYKVW